MSRDFILINLDKRQYCFTDDAPSCEKEFWPAPSVYIMQAPPAKDPTMDIRSSVKSSVLSRIPPELYDFILESLRDYLDCVFFGLTCRFLWNVARRHVKKRYEEFAPRTWAGDRVFCTGGVSWRKDGLPAGLLTEAEVAEWNTPQPTEGCRCRRTHEPNFLSLSYADFAFCRFEHTPTSIRPDLVSHAALQRGIGARDFVILRTLLNSPSRPVLQEVELERPLVLRNLLRKLYVHEEALDQYNRSRPEVALGNKHAVGFVDVLLLRAPWSTAPSSNPAAVRGPWAGDRFDYVSAKDFRFAEGGDDGEVVEWTSVMKSCAIWEEVGLRRSLL